ncbi:MAG: copper-binding protein [Myxococcota bacterium]
MVTTTACDKGESKAEEAVDGPVRDAVGTIKSFSEDRKTITIAHEKIEGFMEAMTMPFHARDAALAEGLKVGDAVKFSFVMNRDGKMILRTLERG